MTSLSQSVQRRPTLLCSLLNYISSIERYLVVFSGSVGQLYTQRTYVGKAVRFQDGTEQIPCCKGAQTFCEKWTVVLGRG